MTSHVRNGLHAADSGPGETQRKRSHDISLRILRSLKSRKICEKEGLLAFEDTFPARNHPRGSNTAIDIR